MQNSRLPMRKSPWTSAGAPLSGRCACSQAVTSSSSRQVARPPALPQPREAPDLALEIPLGPAEVAEAAALEVDAVQRRERGDHPLRHRGAVRGVAQAGRSRRGHRHAVEELHDVERHAEQRLVLAGGEHARDRHAGALQPAQHARLAQHVVGRRRQRRARRATEHDARALAAHAVGDVRVALADLGRVDRPAADPLLVQEPLDRVAVQQRREIDCVLRRRSGHRYV